MASFKNSRSRSSKWAARVQAIREGRVLRQLGPSEETAFHQKHPQFVHFFRNNNGDFFGIRSNMMADMRTMTLTLCSLSSSGEKSIARIKIQFREKEFFFHDLIKSAVQARWQESSFSKADLRPRGLGVLGAFIAAILPEARRLNIERLTLMVDNEKMEKYYRGFGFRRIVEHEKTNINSLPVKMELLLENS